MWIIAHSGAMGIVDIWPPLFHFLVELDDELSLYHFFEGATPVAHVDTVLYPYFFIIFNFLDVLRKCLFFWFFGLINDSRSIFSVYFV